MSEDTQPSAAPAVRNSNLDTDNLIENIYQRLVKQSGLERQTRVSYYAIVADILVLANLASASKLLREAIDVRFQALAPKTELDQTLDYKLCVVVFNAKERDERKKAGKVGRVLPILRKETGGGVKEVVEHLANNSGIEGLLKLHSPSSTADRPAKEGEKAAEVANADEAGDIKSSNYDDDYDQDNNKEEISAGDERAFETKRVVDLPVQKLAWLLEQINKHFWSSEILLVEVEEETFDEVVDSGDEGCVAQLEPGLPNSDGFTPVRLTRLIVNKAK